MLQGYDKKRIIIMLLLFKSINKSLPSCLRSIFVCICHAQQRTQGQIAHTTSAQMFHNIEGVITVRERLPIFLIPCVYKCRTFLGQTDDRLICRDTCLGCVTCLKQRDGNIGTPPFSHSIFFKKAKMRRCACFSLV